MDSNARIVVDERCNTLEDIQLFAAAHASDVIQIKMPDVGSIADSILPASGTRSVPILGVAALKRTCLR
jgi:methylaspartate ammonia-lyase